MFHPQHLCPKPRRQLTKMHTESWPLENESRPPPLTLPPMMWVWKPLPSLICVCWCLLCRGVLISSGYFHNLQGFKLLTNEPIKFFPNHYMKTNPPPLTDIWKRIVFSKMQTSNLPDHPFTSTASEHCNSLAKLYFYCNYNSNGPVSVMTHQPFRLDVWR